MSLAGRMARPAIAVIVLLGLGILGGALLAASTARVYRSEALVVLTPVVTATGVSSNDYLEGRARTYASYAAVDEFGASMRGRAGGDPGGQYPQATVSQVNDTSALSITVDALTPETAQLGAAVVIDLLTSRAGTIDSAAAGAQPLVLQVVSPPPLSYRTVSPGSATFLTAGAAAGLALGLALAVALARSDARLVDMTSVTETWPGVPVAVALSRRGTSRGTHPGHRRTRQLQAFAARALPLQSGSPHVVVLTAAARGPVHPLARELAGVIAAEDRRVAVVDLDRSTDTDGPEHGAASAPAHGLVVTEQDGPIDVLITASETDARDGAVPELVAAVSTSHDTVLVVTDSLDEDARRQSWVRVADTVLLHVPLGRTDRRAVQRSLDLVSGLGGRPAFVVEGRMGDNDPEFHYPAATEGGRGVHHRLSS